MRNRILTAIVIGVLAVGAVLQVNADRGELVRLASLFPVHFNGFADDFVDKVLGRVRSGLKNEDGVERFATLPAGQPGHPEGIAADKWGNIYVASFELGGSNAIYIFNRHGRLRKTIPLPADVSPLGLIVDREGQLFVANFFGGTILKYESPLTTSGGPDAEFEICVGPGEPAPTPPEVVCGLNAMTFGPDNLLYVSDSFGGKIFQVDPGDGGFIEFFADPLLTPGDHAFPPFGANGLAFNAAGTELFIANTGDDRIFRLILANKTLKLFVQSLNGADGILFDKRGRLWVAENQNDRVVALDEQGRIVERRGSFEGVGRDGTAKGLLFPASIVLSEGSIFVTNAALALQTGGDAEASEPEADVTTFTVSKIPLGGH